MKHLSGEGNGTLKSIGNIFQEKCIDKPFLFGSVAARSLNFTKIISGQEVSETYDTHLGPIRCLVESGEFFTANGRDRANHESEESRVFFAAVKGAG